jgi:hypothetical protein
MAKKKQRKGAGGGGGRKQAPQPFQVRSNLPRRHGGRDRVARRLHRGAAAAGRSPSSPGEGGSGKAAVGLAGPSPAHRNARWQVLGPSIGHAWAPRAHGRAGMHAMARACRAGRACPMARGPWPHGPWHHAVHAVHAVHAELAPAYLPSSLAQLINDGASGGGGGWAEGVGPCALPPVPLPRDLLPSARTQPAPHGLGPHLRAPCPQWTSRPCGRRRGRWRPQRGSMQVGRRGRPPLRGRGRRVGRGAGARGRWPPWR